MSDAAIAHHAPARECIVFVMGELAPVLGARCRGWRERFFLFGMRAGMLTGRTAADRDLDFRDTWCNGLFIRGMKEVEAVESSDKSISCFIDSYFQIDIL